MANNLSSNDHSMRAVAREANIVNKPVRVLAVDDEEFNIEILSKHLNKAGFDTALARSGEEAWRYLEEHPGQVDIILMDKMMPGINGVELTRKIKADPKLKHIVVIMQTAAVGTQAVVEGIEAGVYYYLTKPYAAEVLISIVSAAARDFRQQNQVNNKFQDTSKVISTIKKCEFEFKTLEEARSLAIYIANLCPEPNKISMGLAGLFVNAVEHGNLNIGYQKKMELLNEGKYDQEIAKRFAIPEIKERFVYVKVTRENNQLFIYIKDQGNGFDPRPYLDFDPSRITDPNGRGIAMANIMENCKVEYLGKGNEVLCTVQLGKK